MNRKLAMALSGVLLAITGAGVAVLAGGAAPARSPSPYLFVWAGEMNTAAIRSQSPSARRGRDFLAVFDVTPKPGRYGRLVATLPVEASAQLPHHTNYSMPADDFLFANDFDAARTFIFDLRDPVHPKLKSSFGAAGSYTHPHSFARLANGHTLATFQQQGSDNTAPGALAELDAQGRVLRTSAAADPQADPGIRPYSFELIPALDRVVSTSADMYQKSDSHAIQVWRLSDLKLLKTIALPRAGSGAAMSRYSLEPRLLADGHTVLVSTLSCGLYRIDGLEGAAPEARLVYDFGGRDCAVPVVAGRYWIEALQSTHCIVSLDVSDPAHPVEVGRIVLGPRDLPHWLALEPRGNRIVITGYGDLFYRMLMARVDPATGQLSLDEGFRDEGSDQPGVSFARNWPDGWQGPAIPHGAVFSRPQPN